MDRSNGVGGRGYPEDIVHLIFKGNGVSSGSMSGESTYTKEDALRVFEEREDEKEPLTAVDVAEGMGSSRRTATNRLDELVEGGRLKTKKTGARGRVYWK